MNFDMPYLKFQSLVHNGLGAIPSARACDPYSVEIGVIADETGITWFSRRADEVLRAQCTIMVEGDVIVKESGGVAILTENLILGHRGDGSSVPFRKNTVERMLSPPDLIAGFDKSDWRVRCFSASNVSVRNAEATFELHWDLYRPGAVGRGPLLSCGFAGAPLKDAMILGASECLLSINRNAMQRCVRDLGSPSNCDGAVFAVNLAEGSCYISLQCVNCATMVELPPGGFNATCENIQLSLAYSNVLSVIGKDPDADVHILSVSGGPAEGKLVRLQVSDHAADMACSWDARDNTGPHYFDAPRQTRPIIVDRMEMNQGAALVLTWKSDKVRLRLHHDKALLTFIRGSRMKKNSPKGSVAAVACQLPPAPQCVSTWCVRTGDLLKAICAIEGNSVRIRPRDDALIFDDPDRPFAKYRLTCLPPDELDAEVESHLLELEAEMLSCGGED